MSKRRARMESKKIFHKNIFVRTFLHTGLLVFMIFSIMLFPATSIPLADTSVLNRLLSNDIPNAEMTPLMNNHFVFYWSPIDPLFYEDNGMDRNLNGDWGRNPNDADNIAGADFYGESYLYDEGALAISSYDNNNEIEIKLVNGHKWDRDLVLELRNTPRTMENNASFAFTVVYDDENSDYRSATLEEIYPASNEILASFTLDKMGYQMFRVSDELELYDGVLEITSTGRISVQTMTITDAYIDKNGNGIADPYDEEDGVNSENQIAHGIDTAWFANSLGDDGIWSFYGKEYVGFIHRDLFLAGYEDGTKITVTDLSDGDDSFEIELDAWEHYAYRATFVTHWNGGDLRFNISREDHVELMNRAIDGGHNFEADWVHIKSNKPIGIYGGIWDNNIHTQVYGNIGQRYYVPVPTGLTITGLERETPVIVDFDNQVEGDTEFQLKPGEVKDIRITTSQSYSDNYVGEFSWATIDAQHPIRVELWQANDDNSFDDTTMSTIEGQFDYMPASEDWHIGLHHRSIVYVIALEDDTIVSFDGDWLDGDASPANLDYGEVYRIVADSREDYNGDKNDDSEPNNQGEFEGRMHKIKIGANKKVSVYVRYARDYSCEPQDIDYKLSTNPVMRVAASASPTMTYIPFLVSTTLLINVILTASGKRGPVSWVFTDKKM